MERPANYHQEERPWGRFERFTLNEPSTVKLIFAREGEECSLQTHANRDEFWRVVHGSGTITVGSNMIEAKPDVECFIPRGTIHRFLAGNGGLTILEITFGMFDEHDVVRLEDKYGRV